jgi:hypothetical protein
MQAHRDKRFRGGACKLLFLPPLSVILFPLPAVSASHPFYQLFYPPFSLTDFGEGILRSRPVRHVAWTLVSEAHPLCAEGFESGKDRHHWNPV